MLGKWENSVDKLFQIILLLSSAFTEAKWREIKLISSTILDFFFHRQRSVLVRIYKDLFINEHILIVQSCFKKYHILLLGMVKEMLFSNEAWKPTLNVFSSSFLIHNVIRNIRECDNLKFKTLKNTLENQAVVSIRGHCILSSIPKDFYLLLKSWWHSWILPNIFWGQPIHFILKPGSFCQSTLRWIRVIFNL